MGAVLLLDAMLADLPARDAHELEKRFRYDWDAWARPKQREPEGEWDILGLVAGRGGGKTRPGAEATRDRAERYPGIRMALVGRTAADVRDTMVLGESGVIAVSPPWNRPSYHSSKRLLVWPNGSMATMYSAEKPDQLRGPQHQFVWGDEFAAWKKLEAWTNLMDGNRLRSIPNLQPQVVLTTTPRRTDLVSDTFLGNRDYKGKRLVSKEQMRSGSWEFTQTVTDKKTGLPVNLRTVVRRWSTEENASNLSAGYAAKRRMKYGDSSLGRQELDAEILEKVEGALWQQETFDTFRVTEAPKLKRIEVAVDPTRSGDPVDECGIVVGGLGLNGEGYILADLTMKGSPDAWIRVVAGAYHKYRADAVILEDNLLGEDIKHALRTALAGGKFVPVTASSDKAIRAAPVSALYEQGKVHHVVSEKDQAMDDNPLAALEEECCVWDPMEPKMSPNRLDAAVWLVTSLMIGVKPSGVAPRGVGSNPRAGGMYGR